MILIDFLLFICTSMSFLLECLSSEEPSVNLSQLYVLKDAKREQTYADDENDRTITYIKGQRGARKIYCSGFSYICAKNSNDRKYWVCAKQRSRNCKARLITDAKETLFIRRNQLHNHPMEKTNMKADKLIL